MGDASKILVLIILLIAALGVLVMSVGLAIDSYRLMKEERARIIPEPSSKKIEKLLHKCLTCDALCPTFRRWCYSCLPLNKLLTCNRCGADTIHVLAADGRSYICSNDDDARAPWKRYK